MSISRSFHVLSSIKRSQGEEKKGGGLVWGKLENRVLAIVRCVIK